MGDSSDMRQRLTDEVRLLLPELLEASTAYRAAKLRYKRRRDAFAGSANQDIEVAQDRLAKKASTDCSWYGSEMERLSGTLIALSTALDWGRRAATGSHQPRPDPPDPTGTYGAHAAHGAYAPAARPRTP